MRRLTTILRSGKLWLFVCVCALLGIYVLGLSNRYAMTKMCRSAGAHFVNAPSFQELEPKASDPGAQEFPPEGSSLEEDLRYLRARYPGQSVLHRTAVIDCRASGMKRCAIGHDFDITRPTEYVVSSYTDENGHEKIAHRLDMDFRNDAGDVVHLSQYADYPKEWNRSRVLKKGDSEMKEIMQKQRWRTWKHSGVHSVDFITYDTQGIGRYGAYGRFIYKGNFIIMNLQCGSMHSRRRAESIFRKVLCALEMQYS